MKTLLKSAIIACLIILVTVKIQAQTNTNDQSLLQRVNQDDQTAIDAVAMYPKEVRTTIFIACMNPEIIARLSAMQKKTNADFTSLLSPYSKEEQEKIWNLTRYPGLITKITEYNRKSGADINTVLASYPSEIRQTAIDEGTKNYDLFVKINQSNKTYNSEFEQLMLGYPTSTITAFKTLLNQPDILDVLATNMHMTVVVGDVYKKNPALVIHNADSLNLVLSQKSKQDAADWQQTLDKDTLAKQQYQQATKDYAKENGYATQSYSTPLTNAPTNYNSYPYNWWFGYPSWYTYSYWRPYPYWYDFGYYYGYNNRMVYYGMPSGRFLNWYWFHSSNHYHYSAFSNHCYQYYNMHNGAYGYNPVCKNVYDWRIHNSTIITKDWDKNNANRPALFKEYGQMEMNRESYNVANPQATLNNKEFLNSNQDKYPAMNASIANSPGIKTVQETQPAMSNTIQPALENNSTSKDFKNISQPTNAVQPVYNNPQSQEQHHAIQPQQFDNSQQQVNLKINSQSIDQNSSVDYRHYNNSQETANPIQNGNPHTNSQNLNQSSPSNYNQNYNAQPSYDYPQQYHNAQENHNNTWQQSQPRQPSYSQPSYQQAAPMRPNYQVPMQQSAPQMQAPSRQSPPAMQSAPSNFRRN